MLAEWIGVMGSAARGRASAGERRRHRRRAGRAGAADRTVSALPIPLGHRVYVVPCRHYAVVKGCGYDPLSARLFYLLLCDGRDPAWWAYEETVIDCGDAAHPRALFAPGGLA